MENETSPRSELFTDTVAVKLGLFAGVAVFGACVLWWGLSVESWLGKIGGPVLLAIGLVALVSYFVMEYSLWTVVPEESQEPAVRQVERPAQPREITIRPNSLEMGDGRKIPVNPNATYQQ